jgi:hypothetical protein
MGPFPVLDRLTELTVPLNAKGAGKGDAKGEGKGKGGGRGVNIANALRGPGPFQLASYRDKGPAAAIASVPAFEVKELEYTTFAGEPVYMASNAIGETRMIPVKGEPVAQIEAERIMNIVRTAAGGQLAELRLMHRYDAYYLDRTGERPLPVIYARMNDAASTRYYIDPKTARVAGNYSSRNWISRWLYHGLHSLDFPWLYNHRPLWDVVVIALMLGGTALCVTSLLLAWRVVKRKLVAMIPLMRNPPNEDLI